MQLRPYQIPIFRDNTTGVLVLHWSRQIGKSTVLSAWAIDRCLTRPGRLVTVLSNSMQNGLEFAEKCKALLTEYGATFEAVSQQVELEMLGTEIRLTVAGRKSRIKVLPANPRTARGFSGDGIFDEFAHQQDDRAIWDAAEPIFSANPDFLVRIAGTGNGRNNLFYEMCAGGRYPISRVSRTDAYRMGVNIYDPITRQPITPDQARAAAIDKVAYDQNYELSFVGGGASLLNTEAILKAETHDTGEIIDGPPTLAFYERLARHHQIHLGHTFIGIDVGRSRDLTVATLLHLLNGRYHLRAVIRLSGMPFKDQEHTLSQLIEKTAPIGGAVDMTGIGLGLAEALCNHHPGILTPIHFSQTTPWINNEDARIPEAMAINLLNIFETERIAIPPDSTLRASLQTPERSGNTRGMIYTPRSASGHADDFWSLALAAWSARAYETPFQFNPIHLRARQRTTTL